MSVTVRQRPSAPGAGRAPGADGGTGAERGRAVRPAAAHTTDGRTARDVVFYRLGKKFVDHERSIPEDVRSVLYYTLAIGHHTGVIDCLEPRLATSRVVFSDVLAALGTGEAADKLRGIERFGEIELKKEHVPLLKPAVLAALEGCGTVPEPGTAAAGLVVAADVPSWLEEFLFLLDEVQCEPAVYAMGRRVS
ncbi:formate hydrogenlyase maturation HycH family protein [Adlercreutzia caecimuris]|uniref:formate hydrogenlyase maturation HycH family protein n=1 Tax=Adlercreutzia caecimuris TaxID=671266 RepID=UPI000A016948|nr:formate hydrogenlyase maturation HycH family protein [Adlercreutzia caecimuris]NBJ67321.1 hypothetical protein [Adlercreutzia caecimuris]